MAISAAIQFEVRPVGSYANASDLNAGGFKSGASGTDYSHASVAADGGPRVIIDGATITCTVNAITTKLDIAGYTTAASDIGNLVNITGGSMTAGLYEITAQTGGNQWTVDRAAGTAGQTGTGRMGGCFATPGKAAAVATVANQAINVRSGTYTITTATPGAAGPVLFASAVAATMEGYYTSHGDGCVGGTRPVLDWGAVSAPGSATYLFSFQGSARQTFANLQARGGSVNNVCGFNIANTRAFAVNCISETMNGTAGVGFLGSLGVPVAESCYALTCLVGFSLVNAHDCVASGCATGYSSCVSFGSISMAHSTAGFLGTTGNACVNCTADGATNSDGFSFVSVVGVCINCISSNHTGTGTGFKNSGGLVTKNCASYNNTTEFSAGTIQFGSIPNASFSGGQPYASAGSDYRPNKTASSGALLTDSGIGVYGQSNSRTNIGACRYGYPAIPVAANVRYTASAVYGDADALFAGALEIPNSGTPTGTQDATSDACVVSGKKYGSPQRTGNAAGGGGTRAVIIGG